MSEAQLWRSADAIPAPVRAVDNTANTWVSNRALDQLPQLWPGAISEQKRTDA